MAYPARPKTVKIKSDAHPSGYILVNEGDPRANKPVRGSVAESATPKPKRRGRPRKSEGDES